MPLVPAGDRGHRRARRGSGSCASPTARRSARRPRRTLARRRAATERLMREDRRAGRRRSEPRRSLVVDGDSLAHRAYHALPKSISARAAGRRARSSASRTCSLRLWEAEQPRAVVVGWDTLEVPTYRHEAFPAYQCGPRVRRRAPRAARRCCPSSSRRSASSSAKGAGLRGGRLPGGGRRAERGARRNGARRDVGPGRIPARERPT